VLLVEYNIIVVSQVKHVLNYAYFFNTMRRSSADGGFSSVT